MDRSIDVEMTPRLVWREVSHRLSSGLFVFGALFLFSSIGLLWRGGHLPWQTFITPGLLLLIFTWLVFISYRTTMAQVKKMETPVIHLRFTDEYLFISSDLSSAQISWTAYKGLRKHPQFWGIMTQQGSSVLLPVELLDEELKQFLSDKLPKAGSTKRFFMILGGWLLAFIIVMYFFRGYFEPKPQNQGLPNPSGTESKTNPVQ